MSRTQDFEDLDLKGLEFCRTRLMVPKNLDATILLAKLVTTLSQMSSKSPLGGLNHTMLRFLAFPLMGPELLMYCNAPVYLIVCIAFPYSGRSLVNFS